MNICDLLHLHFSTHFFMCILILVFMLKMPTVNATHNGNFKTKKAKSLG